MSGTQLGLMLAYMSTRVLGQYDLLIRDEEPEEQDIVYYVGPNVVAIEERHGFVASQFRLWLALHEVTHRMQFTAVPWLRDHFVNLVGELLEPLHADPSGLARRCGGSWSRCGPAATPWRSRGSSGCWPRPSSAWRSRRSPE